MCGLIAMLSKGTTGFFTKDSDIFKQMLYADALRGWDATGVMGVDRLGNVDIKKQAAAAGHFLTTPQYETFSKNLYQKYHAVIGHNRKATHGDKKHADAHPFWDKEEKICLVHNGMISNHKTFCTTSTVDSAAIANALATDSIEDVISKVEGAFAFIWYNVEERKIHFIRNSLRTLFISEIAGSYILSSEQALPLWICSRNDVKIDSVESVVPMTLYTYDLDTHKIVQGEEIKKKSTSVITYLPSHRPTGTTTTETIPSTTTRPFDTYHTLNGAGESEYLSDNDIIIVEDVLDLLRRKDKINIQITTYEGPQGKLDTYKLTGRMINVKADFVLVTLFLTKPQFDPLDISGVLQVTITNFQQSGGNTTIYANKPEPVVSCTTLNDVIITDPMWYDDKFPLDCNKCGGRITYEDLTNCNITLDGGTVSSVHCPICTGASHV
jgi:hypothetical protein